MSGKFSSPARLELRGGKFEYSRASARDSNGTGMRATRAQRIVPEKE